MFKEKLPKAIPDGDGIFNEADGYAIGAGSGN